MADLYMKINGLVHSDYCDIYDNIRPYGVLSFFQDIAAIHAENIGVGFKETKDKGYYWVILYEQFEVVSRLPQFTEDIVIKTWPKVRGKLEFEREYEICDKFNNVLVKGISNWVLIDTERRMISRASDVNYIGEHINKSNYSEKQKRKLGLKCDKFIKEYVHIVNNNDLDHNMHMNNCKYLDILYNMQDLDKYKKWKKVEIAFIKEAKLNDELRVRYFVNENGLDCYIGYVDDNECFEAIVYLEE